jgi:hypothetical protein
MPYLDCPSCRLRLHTGLLYAAFDICPRCGAALRPPSPSFRERVLRVTFPGRRPRTQPPDWEQITRAQYADRQYVNREERPIRNGGRAAPA